MSLVLRPYQDELIRSARSLMMKGCKSILLQSPTGSGKTALTAHMLKTAAEKGMPSVFTVHRRELVKQSMRAFHRIGLRHGIIAPGFLEDTRPLVQIASIQALSRRLGKLRSPKMIVWDEAHHVAAGSWTKVYESYPNAFHVGLTATPERLDGTGLGQWFKEMINGPSTASLIEDGFLAPYRLYAPGGIVTEGVGTRMGDFARAELNSAADKPTITGDAIRHYKKLASGRRAVVFCCSVEHSKHVVSQFNADGIPAAHVDGETDTNERDQRIAQFERGDILILSNVELFGEGFDLPAIEAAILLRPTQSLGLYLQQVGRALRTSPGKTDAVILDHAGNCARHGLPDSDREWSLSGREKRGGSAEPSVPVRICPKCFAAQFPGSMVCKHCGAQFESAARKVVEEDGELVEIDANHIRRERLREQSQAKTFEELVELGKRRGHKRPHLWAKHIFNFRQSKKLFNQGAV